MDFSFSLAAQPVRNPNGSIHHYEVLTRLIDSDEDLAVFFKRTESDIKLSTQFDILVLEKALEYLRINPTISIAVNVSGLSASSPEFARKYVQILSESESVGGISVEITETARTGFFGMIRINGFLKMLKRIKVHSYVDDFRGWDFHRVWILSHASTLKVDLSIVLMGNWAIIIAVLFARINFKKVVVEGIEKDLQLKLVQQMNCLAQGFHPKLGRPQALSEVLHG